MGASVHMLSKSKFQLCTEITLMINYSNFWTFQFPRPDRSLPTVQVLSIL